jgi:hypothetical protein
MHSSIEDWKNGWFGVDLALTSQEVDRLIELLQMLKTNPDQHFHMASDYKDAGGVGEITMYLKTAEQKHNIYLSGLALAPGNEIA